jgi:glyoxylase-like metal-dependent hydrolase (beta-lactamase superfamily II)
MKRLVVLLSVVVGGLVTMAVFGQPPQQQQPQPLAIDNVATNLWRVTGGGGNTAVFVRDEGVVLVDTKLANYGQAILDQVRTVTDKPITHIINTHTHGDHTGSNMFFPASVEVVTQANTAANMERMPAFQVAEGAVGKADRTFTDRMTLFSGDESVDLYYFGAGHTNGDAFVVFRDARVMHSGDIFATRGLPLLDVPNGGSGVAIGETLRKAADGIDNVDRVITGHTDTLTWQDFVDYGEFNTLFLEHARAAQAAGKTAEQAAMEFTLPPKFASYNIAGRGGRGGPAGNISIIYNELAAQ